MADTLVEAADGLEIVGSAVIATARAPKPALTSRNERTRRRIIRSAIEVFARRGFHGTRVADIADGAGIAYGLVYHHFKNKEEILSAIFSERWNSYVGYLAELGHEELPLAEKLSRLSHFLIDTYHREPLLMKVIISEISRSYEFMESHDLAQIRILFDALEALIVEGVKTGEVRPGIDPRMATNAMMGIIEMVLTSYVIGRPRPGRSPEHDERQLADMFIGVLGCTAPR